MNSVNVNRLTICMCVCVCVLHVYFIGLIFPLSLCARNSMTKANSRETSLDLIDLTDYSIQIFRQLPTL